MHSCCLCVYPVSIPCRVRVVAVFWINDVLHFVVIESCVGADDGAAYFIFKNARVCVHKEDDGHTQFVFTGPQGAQVVAQFFGQHGDDAVHEIGGGAAFIGVVIGFRTGFDIMGDIGDVNAYLEEFFVIL